MKRLPTLIVAGILVWSLFLAVGAYRLKTIDRWARPLMVLGCGLAFVTFWGVALAVRQRRLDREALEEQESE
jgi:hypothetical protein